MTLTQLRYLVALADHGHFGRAAEACAISQPTLSAQIRKLEDYLDAPLVERGARGATLTSLGESVAARARRMLDMAEEIEGVARRADEPLVGPLRMGAIPTLFPYVLPWTLAALRARHPRLELICREALTADLIDALRRREIDCALAAEPIEASGLERAPLFDEPLLAALPPGHGLSEQGAVSAADLARENLLLLKEGHCLRDHAIAACGAGALGDGNYRATSLETLRSLVAAGEGVTLIPAMAGREGEDIVLKPLETPAARRICLYFLKTSARRADYRMLAKTIGAALPAAVTQA